LQQITAPAPLEDVVEAETGDRSAETRHVWARATCWPNECYCKRL